MPKFANIFQNLLLKADVSQVTLVLERPVEDSSATLAREPATPKIAALQDVLLEDLKRRPAKVAAWKQAASFVDALRGPDEEDLDLRRELIREEEDLEIDHGPHGPGWIIDEEDDAIEKLTKLQELLDVGAITQEEFDAKAAEHLKKL